MYKGVRMRFFILDSYFRSNTMVGLKKEKIRLKKEINQGGCVLVVQVRDNEGIFEIMKQRILFRGRCLDGIYRVC